MARIVFDAESDRELRSPQFTNTTQQLEESLMKRLSCLIMLALGCLLAAAPVYAQSELKVTFTVPFSFTAGTAQLPAGSYSITEDDTGHAVIFPARGGKTSA